MPRAPKIFAFYIAVVLLISSPYLAQSTYAQISKPSEPQFSLAFETDTVVLTIENQPFDPNNSDNYSFYYNVQVFNAGGYYSPLYRDENTPPTQSNIKTTTLTFPVGTSDIFPQLTTVNGIPIPTTGEATFQVNAMVGNWEKTTYSDGTVSYGLKGGYVSGWSNSQTIMLPSTNASSPSIYVSRMGGMSTSYRLTLFSPNEQASYDGVLPLEFMIKWSYDIMPVFEPKTEYAYSIDGNPFVNISANKTLNDRPGGGYTFVYNPSFSYRLDVSNLSNGRHSIEIRALFYFGHLELNDTTTSFAFTVQNSNPHLTLTGTPVPASTATSTSAPTPTVPEFHLTLIVALLFFAASTMLLVGRKKQTYKGWAYSKPE